PASIHDLLVDRVSFRTPSIEWRRTSALLGQPDASIEGDPTHQAAVGKILPAPSGLPDTLLRLVPVVGQPAQDLAHPPPSPVAGFESVLASKVEAVDRLAVDIELELVRGTVPDPHRTRS